MRTYYVHSDEGQWEAQSLPVALAHWPAPASLADGAWFCVHDPAGVPIYGIGPLACIHRVVHPAAQGGTGRGTKS